MRNLGKYIAAATNFSLTNIKRLEVKFDPFHPNAVNIREFYYGATLKRRLKKAPECVTKAQIVCDNSDPIVTVQFKDNHKLVINSKYLESAHIVKIIKQFNEIHKDVSEDV